MVDISIRRELSDILRRLVEELDVPPSKYKEAQEHYDAVGKWLNSPDSEIGQYDPDIYPQGSFALGTVIRPIGEEEYDVDAVCQLSSVSPEQITQEKVKNLVGDRLKEHGRYREMLDPKEGGRRCWTLTYADSSKFHLDILPSISDPEWFIHIAAVPTHRLKTAILITDTITWDDPEEWPKCNRSNPKGYVNWFKEQMRFILEERRKAVAMEKRAAVEDVPDYEVRTPLQRVIQLLKRHRDMRLNGDEDKPISIIITTLAAKAYNNEEDLVDAILNVVSRMREGIEMRDGEYWVTNPINPDENFADKWAETPRKAELFFEWLKAIEEEHRALLTHEGFAKVGDYLTEAYGQRDAGTAMKKYNEARPSSSSLVFTQSAVPARFNVPHRAAPLWRERHTHSVSISARYKHNGSWSWFKSNSPSLSKHCDLLFYAKTDVPGDFSVFWQVVNTGEEAASHGARGLRGRIFPSKTAGLGGLTQKEATLYTGMHWIECFIVKSGICVARSGEFVVNIE